MKITYATNNGDVGGGEVMLFNMARAARSGGHQVTVVAPSAPSEVLDQARAEGFETVEIKATDRRSYARKLRAWDRTRTGLLWCNGLVPSFATSGHPNRVVHLHRGPDGAQKMAALLARRGARATVVPSNFMTTLVPGAQVLDNWTTELDRLPRPDRAPGEPLVIGFIGRLAPEKGIIEYARAMAALQRRHPGRFKAVVAGAIRFARPGEARRVEDALAEVPDLDRAGWVDFRSFFGSVDLAVFPSMFPEPFGLVAAEAMAAGTPFVISDAGALREVAGRDHPWVAPRGDVAALAAVIEQATSVDNRMLCDHARKRWEERFSPAAGMARYQEFLADLERPRVAIAHDYLTQRGGAERVVLSLRKAFPDAEIHTTLYDPAGTYPDFADATIRTSWLNRVPMFRKHHRWALPLLAPASTSTRIDADVVVASSSGWAHSFPSSGAKVIYCHTPARFLYLTDEFLGKPATRSIAGLGVLALRPALRHRDRNAAHGAARYLANSTVIRERVHTTYGLDAEVVPAPFAVNPDGPTEPLAELTRTDYWLVVSRLMAYKNVDRVIEAVRARPDDHLVVIGSGPMERELRATLPANVQIFSNISDSELRWVYAHCRALVAASYEDYGLTPLEAAAFGKPCLALRAGGFLDTVVEGSTGVFFEAPEPGEIRKAMDAYVHIDWSADAIRRHAERFSEDRFVARIREVVAQTLAG